MGGQEGEPRPEVICGEGKKGWGPIFPGCS